jgi:hypothetical protein
MMNLNGLGMKLWWLTVGMILVHVLFRKRPEGTEDNSESAQPLTGARSEHSTSRIRDVSVSESWYLAVWYVGAKVSEKYAAAIFRVLWIFTAVKYSNLIGLPYFHVIYNNICYLIWNKIQFQWQILTSTLTKQRANFVRISIIERELGYFMRLPSWI